MNVAPNPQVTTDDLEQERRRITARLEEVAKLSETKVPPGTFYGELMKRLLESLAAPAGAIWARTAQGNLQLQFQINIKEVGLDQSDESRQSHEELLRQAMSQPRPFHLPPRSGVGPKVEGKASAGNPTNFVLLIAPIVINEQVAGLIEVWQGANRPPQAITGYLQYMGFMAELAARYQRNQMMGQLAGQQQVWTQLEVFARQVHASLNPVEVAYLTANEGRRLVECDRVSVAVRYGAHARMEAVSGADVVEKRSNLIRLMRTLCEQVMKWGEKLVFNGARDDSLPPKVLSALDAYLAESGTKLLVVQPLRDEREKDKDKTTSRSALLMECFEPPSDPQQLIGRLDVVARHAAPALYNAVEHRRIPMRFVWMPIAKVQEGIGGKAKAITLLVVALLCCLGAALYLVPYELKMESTGKLVPWARRVVYPPTNGTVVRFDVEGNDPVPENGRLAIMFDLELKKKLDLLATEAANLFNEAEQAEKNATLQLSERDRNEQRSKAEMSRYMGKQKEKEYKDLIERTNATGEASKRGEFELRAPRLTPEERQRVNPEVWTVLNGNFRDEWTNRAARTSDPLLRLGAKDGPWEIELRIPQKHISQVLRAYELKGEGEPLDIDFLLKSDPTRTYRGKLYRDKIAGEAVPNRDEKDESEPEVIAFVSIDDENIDVAYRLSREALTSGTEVHAKVRCGKHRLGYSLFYGVWEFLYEKVVFFF